MAEEMAAEKSEGMDTEMAEEMSEEMKFEEAMEKLEEVSERLSGEGVPLDEAVALYEQGVKYYDICKRKLDDANRRIRVIEEGAGADEG